MVYFTNEFRRSASINNFCNKCKCKIELTLFQIRCCKWPHLTLSHAGRLVKRLIKYCSKLCTENYWHCVTLTQAVYRQATKNSHREWEYHILHLYNCILLKTSTWGSRHVEDNSILWINNNRCIKLVINI